MNYQRFSVIIPARYASSRLPGKVLLKIGGKALIQHVCDQAAKSQAENIVVATDDERVAAYIERHGYRVLMTSPQCRSGTDRVAQAVTELQWPDESVIVNLQADEPFISPLLINQVAGALIDNPVASMSSACERIEHERDWLDANVVKVVRDKHDMALYFSRSVIPHDRDGIQYRNYFKHIGIYAYKVSYVKKIAAINSCDLEAAEKLEQLRVLYQGDKIIVPQTGHGNGIGVDTQADLRKARQWYAEISS